MPPEELAGFDGRQELPDCGGGPIQNFHQARNSAARVCFWEWPHETRINMNLIRRDEHQDRRAAVVPKLAMKSGDLRCLYFFHQSEVNERSVFGAKNSVELQQVKGTAQDMALRDVRSRGGQLRFAGEEHLLPVRGDAEFASPVLVCRNAHGRPLAPCEEPLRPDASRYDQPLSSLTAR